MALLRVDLPRLLRRSRFILLLLLLLYAVGRPMQIWLDGFYSGDRAPYLQMPSSSAMTIRWQSQEKYSGVVKFGMEPGKLYLTQAESTATEEHEIRLSGLKAGTRYFYSAGSEAKADYHGKTFWFKTLPEVATEPEKIKPVRFWVTGDQGYPGKIQEQVRDAALQWTEKNPRESNEAAHFDFWLTTGDNAYRSGSNPQFQAGFFEPYKSILQNTPVWPIYGNHDSRRWVFFDLFTFPSQAESGGVASGTEHYYSFDYANIHFVMLDTEASDLSVDGDMLSWLKKDLKNTQQQWLVTLLHHPPYSKGSHDSDNKWDSGGRLISVRENILPLLESAGVDLVLAGHSHMYERSHLINCHYGLSSSFSDNNIRDKPTNSIYKKQSKKLASYNGTIYSVVGSSSKVDQGPLNHPAMPYSLREAGSMVVDVNNNKLNAYFINKNGIESDRFEIIKGMKDGVKPRGCN